MGLEDVERELGRFVPAGVPAGLRARVLEGAGQARSRALLPPWMRVAAAACSILIVALFALDPLMTHREEARLAALLNGRRPALAAPETEPELAEVGLGQRTEMERRVRIQKIAAVTSRKAAQEGSLKAMERLKGWLEYEDISEDPE